MYSNCLFWAHWEFAKLMREWRRLGSPVERVPSMHVRPSRSRPEQALHHIVGWWCYRTMTLQDARSFVPDHRHDVPLWLIWTRVLFRGHVKRGDNPSLPPENEP